MKGKLSTALILGLTVLVLALIALPLQFAGASPAPAPTPISAPGAAGSPLNVTFINAQAMAASARSNPIELSAYNRLDLQYVIDQGSDVNTATLTMQTSCTGQNWDPGVAIVSNNAADASAVVSLPNFCRYTAISATLTNTNPVTITVKGVAKQ